MFSDLIDRRPFLFLSMLELTGIIFGQKRCVVIMQKTIFREVQGYNTRQMAQVVRHYLLYF